MTELYWKTKEWGKETVFLKDKLIVGLLKTPGWGQAGYGEIRGYMLRFEPTGVSGTMEIRDIEGTTNRGTIAYTPGQQKAQFELDGTIYQWEKTPDAKGWNLYGPDEAEASCLSISAQDGLLRYNHIDPGALLAGFYLFGGPRKRRRFFL